MRSETTRLVEDAAGARVARLAALGTFQAAPQLFDSFVATVVLQ